ncbi:bifunctional serine/threonine protein kinase/MFS transporter [Streptomyces sp. NBC_01214]|uniref:bifunctional serine/threonine protein kinase/MFS transporter n=1 Tax=Streptomyces sp. NBC_01214 TaxID=2903777 RepID=UPI0022561D37|nr:bifunctional serine/threonine protein kinase/MFS transporter [Streptomyces sp. NBC_01214]MCX4806791.1 bifunctional serine/threonine protein kinase/MFS transporter [Streptomyces sp. NBC_01214]
MDQLIAEDPSRIGPYRLIARLGAGGMGLVYLGRSEGGRTVAVKVVQTEFAGNPEFRRRFAREVAAARRVGGSWTAAVLDADTEAAVPWVATQYIPGPDLQTVVARQFGPLPEDSVRTLANRLAHALRAVHEAGLVHRDLKPSNVLVTVDGPRVIDFGIARAMDSLTGDSLHTRTGMLIGSPGFMSPEQVRGLELGPASDVFCLGAVLVYAATGRMLFGAKDTGLNAHLFRIAEEEADLTGVPESLVELVGACLHKDPALRPTPEEVAARTAADAVGEWLPGAVLAQLGRHAARLLDYAPASPAGVGAGGGTPAEGTPVEGTPVEKMPDPRRVPAQSRQDAPPPVTPPLPPVTPPPPPAYAPTAPGRFGPADGFGPPPGPLPGDPSVPAPPHPRRWWGLAVLALTQLLVLVEAAHFNLLVPQIHGDLAVSADGLVPIFSAYLVALGGLLLLGGHLVDLLGARRMLVAGLIGFAAADVLGGAAGSSGPLITARALQGAFAALLVPASLSLVATGFTDPRERGRAFGIYAAVAAGGGALGVFTGGWLVETLDWRWALWSVVPLAVLALIGALTLLPARPGRTGARFDGLGVLLGTAGSAALAYGLARAQTTGWAVVPSLLLLVVGAALLAAFLWWQAGTSGPLLPAYVLADRSRLASLLAVLFTGVALVALLPALGFFAQQIRGEGPAASGTAHLPLVAAALVVATQVSARLLPRVAPRVLVLPGLVVAALGLALLAGVGGASTYATGVLPGMLLTGIGLGLALAPLYATATAGVAPRHAGAASAALGAAHYLGQSIGGAVLGTVLVSRLSQVSDDTDVFARMLSAYTTTLWCGAGALLLATLPAALLLRTPRQQGGERRLVHRY